MISSYFHITDNVTMDKMLEKTSSIEKMKVPPYTDKIIKLNIRPDKRTQTIFFMLLFFLFVSKLNLHFYYKRFIGGLYVNLFPRWNHCFNFGKVRKCLKNFGKYVNGRLSSLIADKGKKRLICENVPQLFRLFKVLSTWMILIRLRACKTFVINF